MSQLLDYFPEGGIGPIAANTVLGNNTGASALPIALTPAQARTLLDVPQNSALGAYQRIFDFTVEGSRNKFEVDDSSGYTALHIISENLPEGFGRLEMLANSSEGIRFEQNGNRLVVNTAEAALYNTLGQGIGVNPSGYVVTHPSAFRSILGLSPIASNPVVANLSQSGATLNQVIQWNGSAWAPGTVASGGGTWGSITGTLSAQTDLQNALNLKANLASPAFTGTVGAADITASGAITAGGVDRPFIGVSSTSYSMLKLSSSATPSQAFECGWMSGRYAVSTQSAHPLDFETANTTRVRIHAGGGVSIGNTTDPGATNFSVTGSIRVGTDTVLLHNNPAGLYVRTVAGGWQNLSANTLGDLNGINLGASGDTRIRRLSGGVIGFDNWSGTAGFSINVGTDGIAAFRNRTNGADGAISSGAITASGNVNIGANRLTAGQVFLQGRGIMDMYPGPSGEIGICVNGYLNGTDCSFGGRSFVFYNPAVNASIWTMFIGDAANTVGLRNGTNAQGLNIYGTYANAGADYRRLRISSTTAGAFTIAAEGLGTGVSGNTLTIANTLLQQSSSQTTAFAVGKDTSSGYTVVSLNGSLASGSQVGMHGTAADNDLYVTGPGGVRIRQGNNERIRVSSSGTDITGKLSVGTTSTFNTSDFSFNVGSCVIQPFALNNAFFAENAYWNGSSLTRISTGSAVGFQLINEQFMVWGAPSGSGAFGAEIPFKVHRNGTAAIGGNITATPGSTIGAGLVVTGTTAVFAGSVTSTVQNLSTDPVMGTDLTAGQTRIIKNTSTGVVKGWVNDGGTPKSVTYSP